jgi:hypothetical protein
MSLPDPFVTGNQCHNRHRFRGAALEVKERYTVCLKRHRHTLDLTHDFEKKPDETLGSIIADVDNFLAAFLNPWTSEVFCAESPTFSFDQLDDVKLLCISIPATSAPNSVYWFPTTRLCEEILFSLYWPLSPAAPTVFGGACVAICILISWLLVNTALPLRSGHARDRKRHAEHHY